MLKASLISETINVLENSGYTTCRYNGCFDVAAKKDLLLVLKVLQNVDAFQLEQAKNLKIISNNLDAHPFLIGMQTRTEKLRKGIVYERFELPTISLDTFEEIISYEIFPKIFRDRGGLYVEIDREMLKYGRGKKNLTQRELAELVGINKKVIYEHEKKQIRMFLSIAERIEKILNRKIIKQANIFERQYFEKSLPADKLEKIVGRDLRNLGFGTDFVKQAPFDILAKEKTLLISDVEDNRRKILKRAVDLEKFINVTNKPAIVITEKIKDKNLLNIPIIQRKELEEFESGKELMKIAKKRI